MLCLAASFLPFFARPAAADDVYTVRHVSDGDTLVLEDGKKVRLIGVDTPEIADPARNKQNARRNKLDAGTVDDFAEKARRFMEKQVEGRRVRLEYDWQKEDKYGRTLAYVFREDDDVCLNELLLTEGYGFAYLYFPFRRWEEYRAAAEEARLEKRGLWK
jgi:micrococcal nuclease